MLFEIIAGVAIIAEGTILAVILARLGGLINVIRTGGTNRAGIDRLVGKRLPPLRVRSTSGVALDTKTRSVAFDSDNIIFVMAPHCVASHRLLRLMLDLLDTRTPDFQVIFIITDDGRSAARFLDRFPVNARALIVDSSRLWRGLSDAIPFVITLTPGGTVAHAGVVDSEAALARFIEACGLERIRIWFSPHGSPDGGEAVASPAEARSSDSGSGPAAPSAVRRQQ